MKTKAVVLAVLSSILMVSGIAWSQQEPAGEGRRITPAGSFVLDATTHQPEVGALPTVFLRSPDRTGHDAKGRYLLVMFSGYGVQFSAETNHAQQSVGVIDLNASPEPAVIQNVYFPSPQSANVGAAFSPAANADGSFDLYISGGYENKVWVFRFDPNAATPLQPASPGPDTKVEAPFIEVSKPGEKSPENYNDGKAALYPTGIALTPDGGTLLAANNLGDSLTIIRNLHSARSMQRVDLHPRGKKDHNIYPYDVVAVGRGKQARAYVSCWNDASVAVVSLNGSPAVRRFIGVDRHPTALLLNSDATRLFVVNSNADSVSVIDTRTEGEAERIDVRLSESALVGASPEGLALSADEATLYIANAHSNAVAVVALSNRAQNANPAAKTGRREKSSVRGFIPTGQYPAAVGVADGRIFVGNGKGTGFESSSMRVNLSGRTPNSPNENFPPGKDIESQGGQYIGSMVSGNISAMAIPDDPALARYTQQTMQNDGLLGLAVAKLFPQKSPIRHVIYIIKENRTYDQVFGDVEVAGNSRPADGEPKFAIFGNAAAAQRPNGTSQVVTPNQHALALRFGLFDRFFVNSEASPDGHNWSTAAFSTDYVDKGFRWSYADRGRTYDWEGFNRLPDYEPPGNLIVDSKEKDTLKALTEVLEKHVPYHQGSTDIAEPKTLYLWDAAARAGLTHRNFGEFISVISANDVEAARHHREKPYPDISNAVRSIPTKQSLEAHHSPSFRSFDIAAPDSMTVECFRAAVRSKGEVDPGITRENPTASCRGNSRFGEWLAEFQHSVAEREAGHTDVMPALTVMRFPNDHTTGLKPGFPTPQFYVAENDYAVGRLVEAVSNSPYWKDTAIFTVEDDAQSGPDHVDSHRSVALVISAYNRPGALIHEFHNTVSLIRTIELLLGIEPMNQLDASAIPMDIFQETPDLRPYHAILPTVAKDNLMTEKPKDAATAQWMRRSLRQNFAHADMADPKVLNEVIWFACKGTDRGVPPATELPAYQTMRLGIENAEQNEAGEEKSEKDKD